MHALFALLLQNFWFMVEFAPAALSVITASFVDAKKRLVITVYHIAHGVHHTVAVRAAAPCIAGRMTLMVRCARRTGRRAAQD